jgi:hypothetical protein
MKMMHGSRDEVIARVENLLICRAAFEKALFVYPNEHLEMRQGLTKNPAEVTGGGPRRWFRGLRHNGRQTPNAVELVVVPARAKRTPPGVSDWRGLGDNDAAKTFADKRGLIGAACLAERVGAGLDACIFYVQTDLAAGVRHGGLACL